MTEVDPSNKTGIFVGMKLLDKCMSITVVYFVCLGGRACFTVRHTQWKHAAISTAGKDC